MSNPAQGMAKVLNSLLCIDTCKWGKCAAFVWIHMLAELYSNQAPSFRINTKEQQYFQNLKYSCFYSVRMSSWEKMAAPLRVLATPAVFPSTPSSTCCTESWTEHMYGNPTSGLVRFNHNTKTLQVISRSLDKEKTHIMTSLLHRVCVTTICKPELTRSWPRSEPHNSLYLPLRGKFFGILLFSLLEYQFSIFLTCKLFVPQQTANC